MARFDQPGVTYDSNVFSDQPDPVSNPPAKPCKTVKRQDYFHLRIGDQIVRPETKVRARYLYKGEEFGNWCEWHTWTLTGS